MEGNNSVKTDSGHVVFTLGVPESSFKCPRLTGGNCNCTAYCGEYCRAKAEPVAIDAELTRLRKIARLIGAIYVYGGFKAETHNERELETLLREQGTFWQSVKEYEAT